MKRRELLKTLGLSAVGLATIPLWVDAWSSETLPTERLEITDYQKEYLAQLVDTIIPATDTPGAKELGVDKFLLTMVKDCYDKKVQASFKAGFAELDGISTEKYGKNFMEITDKDRLELVSALEAAPEAEDEKFRFVSFVKNLTVMGYRTSEYFLTNIMKYELVPSRFHGSVPVTNTIYHNV